MSKVAVLALVMMTSVHAQGNTVAETIVNNFGKSFYTMERRLASFFSSSDNTKYSIAAEAISKDFAECERLLEAITRGTQDNLAALAYDVADYGRQMFSAVLGIIKEYNGKPATQAKNFKTDIDRVFDPETAFKKIISKLEVLKKEALLENNDALVTQITTVITMIARKKTEWNNKSPLSLGAGLITRMSC